MKDKYGFLWVLSVQWNLHRDIEVLEDEKISLGAVCTMELRGQQIYLNGGTSMRYQDIKTGLISLFRHDKLDGCMDSEWGFTNGTDREVTKIGYATNLTPETINEAVKYHAELIVTHHDAWGFIYGMKEKCLSLLKESDTAHAFFHAPLDDADFGTSSSLASALHLTNHRKAIPYEEKFLAGVIGTLEQSADFDEFGKRLSHILAEPIKTFKNNEKPIRKICVVTGAGNMTSDIKIAVDNHCDTYLTGEYNLYSQQYAKFAGINLMIGSHTNTEIFGVSELVQRLIGNSGMEAVRLAEENY